MSQFLLFLGCLFLLLWKGVDLAVVYHGGGVIANVPAFYWGADFFKELLPQPAGVMSYVAALAIQSFYHAWLGALVVTLQAGLICWLTIGCLSAPEGRRWELLACLPPTLLLGVYARQVYSVVLMNTTLCVLMALALVWALTQTRSWPTPVRCAAIPMVVALLLFTFPGALLLFLLLAVMVELRQRDRLVVATILVVAGLGLPPAIGTWGYDLSLKESYAATAPFPLSLRVFRSSALACLHGFYFGPALIAMLAWGWSELAQARSKPPPEPGKSATPAPAKASHRPHPPAQHEPPHPGVADHSQGQPGVPPPRACLFARWAGECLALGLAAYAAWALSIDPETRAVLQVDYRAYHRDWKGVIDAAKGDPNSIHVQCAVNQALFHLGRLGDDLMLRQNPEALVLYDHRFRPDWNVIDVYLDLGFVGMAHHYLIEAMDIYGERPSLMRRVVIVNTVLGNVGTAKIYLRALEKVPFHAAWAREYRAQLEADPTMAGHKEVARLRSLMMKENQVVPLPIDKLMLSLLQANPRNRMAFEYLMAYYLMTKNLKGFVGQLNRLDQFTMGGLPRLYQEAIVLAVRDLGLKTEARNLALGPDAVERHQRFAQKLKSLGPDPAKAALELQKEFGDSYFYYYFSQ